MDITYDYYRIFYYVAKYGSFSKASVALNRGQPNVTKAISNLEKQLNCVLFVRSSKGVTLTPEGEKLFTHVEIAFSHLFFAENEILSAQSLESGQITIATTEISISGIILSAIKNFSRDFPKVKIEITSNTNEQALSLLKKGLADFAVITKKNDDPDLLKMTLIKEFQEILCVKKGYLTDEDNLGINLLLSYPFICLRKGSYAYEFLQEYIKSQNIDKKPDIEVANINQALLLVKRGIGLAFIPEVIASEYIKKGELEEVPLCPKPRSRQIYLIEDKKRSLSIAAKKFTEYLK